MRDAAVLALRDLGYTVIEASDGAEAKTVLTGDTHIDLLFTDVVMPGGMTGRMLADEAQRLRPGLRVLFTSGYTDNTIVHHGRLDPGVRFIAKPYRTRDLAAQIRSVLDAGAPETSERAVDTR